MKSNREKVDLIAEVIRKEIVENHCQGYEVYPLAEKILSALGQGECEPLGNPDKGYGGFINCKETPKRIEPLEIAYKISALNAIGIINSKINEIIKVLNGEGYEKQTDPLA